jgi:hypothetical protein
MPITFDATCNGFSLANAYFLAKASSAAYSAGAEFAPLMTELGLTPFPATTIVNDISFFAGQLRRPGLSRNGGEGCP